MLLDIFSISQPIQWLTIIIIIIIIIIINTCTVRVSKNRTDSKNNKI